MKDRINEQRLNSLPKQSSKASLANSLVRAPVLGGSPNNEASLKVIKNQYGNLEGYKRSSDLGQPEVNVSSSLNIANRPIGNRRIQVNGPTSMS